MNTNKPTSADIIGAYIKLRDAVKQAEQAHKEKIKPLQIRMEQLKAVLDAQMAAEGVNSIASDNGTAFYHTTTKARCEDWAAFESWMDASGRHDMLERRISASAVKTFLEENNTDPNNPVVIPGVRLTAHDEVRFRA